MNDPTSLNKEFSNNVFKNFNDLFFNPEIERRKKINEITEPFHLIAAQVIFSANGEKPIVRINEEVKATVKLKKGVKHDDETFWASRQQVEQIEFDDKDYLNCGHATMILFADGYQLTFDFRYNKEVCKQHLTLAKEFLEVANFSYQNKYFSAFIDNSFSTIELLAKCRLLIETNKSVYGKTNHKKIKSEYNKRYKNNTGSFEVNERSVFNKLSDLRSSARYMNGEIHTSNVDLVFIHSTLNIMFQEIEKSIS